MTTFKEEMLEISWSEDKKEYFVSKGAVKLGYFGEFSLEKMDFLFNDGDLETLLEKENYETDLDNNKTAEKLTEYINGRIADLKKHITEINQAFLAYIMDDMFGCGYPFWSECPKYVIWDKMPEVDAQNMERAIYSEAFSSMCELFDKYYETAMDGEVDNTTYVEDFIKEKLPMFDYKKMLEDVYGSFLYLGIGDIAVQSNGEDDAQNIVCEAMINIRDDNSFYDWHNR